MKIIITILIATFIFLPFSHVIVLAKGESGYELTDQTETETDQLIVRFIEKPNNVTLSQYEVVDSESEVVTVKVPKNEIEEYVEKFEKRNDVLYVEPDYVVERGSVPNDPYFSDQWYHQVIQTPQAWQKTYGSEQIIVAIIDDGIDVTHKDLTNQIVRPYDFVNSSSTNIRAGKHGTHVAGIVAASMNNQLGGIGIAPQTKIMPINVFNGDKAYTSDIIKAIQYAVQNGANIINFSLGMPTFSKELEEAIQSAYKSGVLIIAASGNDSNSEKFYPASYREVISVSATDQKDQLADYSNYGSDIDLSAPGTQILSTLPNGMYGFFSGTSMAAPIVAGAAALLWSMEPDLSRDEVAERLLKSVDDLGAAGKDIYYGHGRVNLAKLVNLQTPGQPIVEPVTDKDTSITGQVEATSTKGKIVVVTSDGQEYIAQVENQMFKIEIPKQKARTVISITYTSEQGISSKPVVMSVLDQTPPKRPVVSSVSNKDKVVKGSAEAGSTVIVRKGTKRLGYAKAKKDGTFTVEINKQKAGARLEITATDSAKNVSSVRSVTVKDKIPPKKPTVKPLFNNSTKLKGKTEAYAVITVKNGSKTIGKGKANSKGNFSIKIGKMKAGTKIKVYAADKSGNKNYTTVKVSK